MFQKGCNISDRGLKDPHAHHKSLTHIRDHIGRMLFEDGKTKDAIAVFHDALRRMPEGYDPVSVYNMLGQCYSRLDEGERAEGWYSRALDTKPDHVPALLTYSKHMTRTNPKKSEQLLEKALRLDPNRTETLLMYAGHLRTSGRTEEALKLLVRAFQLNRNDTEVLNELSVVHREKGEYFCPIWGGALLCEAPPGGCTQSRNHADFFSLSRIHAMRGKFGFSRNIAKFWLKITQEKFSFQEFTQKFYAFHASRMDVISRIYTDFFRFHAVTQEKKANHAIAQTYDGEGPSYIPENITLRISKMITIVEICQNS